MSAENTVGLEGYARVSSLFGWFVILAMIVLAGVSLAVNPLLTLLTAIVCVSAFFLLGRIEVVVWLIVFLTPLETFLNVSFVHTKVIKLALVAFSIFSAFVFVRVRKDSERGDTEDPYRLPLVLLLASGFIATVLAQSPLQSLFGFSSLLLFVFYYFGLLRVTFLGRLGPRLLRTVVFVAVPSAILALLQMTQGYGRLLGSREQQAAEEELRTLWPSIERASAAFNGPNAAGSFLGVATIVALLHAIVLRQNRKRYLVFALLSVLGMFATFSRGALLGLMVGLGFAAWRLGYFRVRWRLAMAAAFVMAMTGMLILSEDARTFFRLGTDLISVSESRVDAWEATLTIIHRNPVTGIGFYGFQEIARGIEGVSDTTIHPHNGVLKALVEQGPLGGFAYLLLLWTFIRLAARPLRILPGSEDEWVWITIGSVGLCLFTHELFDAGFTVGGSSMAILFATLLALQVQIFRLATVEERPVVPTAQAHPI